MQKCLAKLQQPCNRVVQGGGIVFCARCSAFHDNPPDCFNRVVDYSVDLYICK